MDESNKGEIYVLLASFDMFHMFYKTKDCKDEDKKFGLARFVNRLPTLCYGKKT